MKWKFKDHELIEELIKVGGDPEKLPGNAGGFFRQQAKPERDKQLAAAALVRCIYCSAESPKVRWQAKLDAAGNECCPKCGRAYDTAAAILAQEGDD